MIIDSKPRRQPYWQLIQAHFLGNFYIIIIKLYNCLPYQTFCFLQF